MQFREFVQEEYTYVERYPAIYKNINRRDTPTECRKANTVANEMQVLRAFFTELEDTEEISRSPFRKISRDRRIILTRKKYDDSVFLRRDEFDAVCDFKPSKKLVETRETFLLHCALGWRIGDFQRLTMDNIGVSEEGIPYVHYLPEKTKGTQKDNSEVITPLVRYAFELIKKTQFNLPILKYPSGKSGYNKKIKQLLTDAGIDRKVQINIYAAGLHRHGSGAVNRYTMMEIKDRFELMNIAFSQDDYRVDKNLNIIDSPVEKDC